MRENFTNFATTALVTPNPLTSGGTSFTVTGGQGALYPTTNFVVAMDSELMFISSRSTDTFTIQTRGFDGTTAASHTVGATIQLAVCAYNITHIWQNIADSYNPVVPPVQLGGSAGSIDNEFESLGGSWVLNPSSPSGSTVWAANTVRSNLTFARSSSDTGLYTAYVPFTPGGGAFTITTKISQGINVDHNVTDTCTTNLFVSDQSTPTGGPNSGNNIRLETVLGSSWSSGNLSGSSYQLRPAQTTSGSGAALSPNVQLSPGQALWLRITNDGSGNWSCYFGDGVAYWRIATFGSVSFTIRTVGFMFRLSGSSGQLQTVAVDYLRMVSSVLPGYGS